MDVSLARVTASRITDRSCTTEKISAAGLSLQTLCQCQRRASRPIHAAVRGTAPALAGWVAGNCLDREGNENERLAGNSSPAGDTSDHFQWGSISFVILLTYHGNIASSGDMPRSSRSSAVLLLTADELNGRGLCFVICVISLGDLPILKVSCVVRELRCHF